MIFKVRNGKILYVALKRNHFAVRIWLNANNSEKKCKCMVVRLSDNKPSRECEKMSEFTRLLDYVCFDLKIASRTHLKMTQAFLFLIDD